jgi:hypothetical protein
MLGIDTTGLTTAEGNCFRRFLIIYDPKFTHLQLSTDLPVGFGNFAARNASYDQGKF